MLAIIMLNWNGWKDTIETLESIYNNDYDDYFVLLIDNGSTDNSLAEILEWLTRNAKNYLFYKLSELKQAARIIIQKRMTIVIANPKNYGFAGGNNIGIYIIKRYIQPKPKYVLFLNNDVYVPRASLKKLVDIADKVSDLGALNPTILFYHNPRKIQYLYGFIDWFGLLMPLNMANMRRKFKIIDINKEGKLIVSERALGAALLVRYIVLEKVGYFRTEYFLQVEDTDFSFRIQAAGYKLYGYTGAFILHKGSVTLNKVLTTKFTYLIRNRFLFRVYYASLPSLFIFTLWWLLVESPILLTWNYKKFRSHSVLEGFINGIKSVIKLRESIDIT